ncbi:MAG: hypothetical protein RL518_162 [Pseudomonadota bacterium]|jgi:uncharacterized integral membrane protein (TIGR00697 family)
MERSYRFLVPLSGIFGALLIISNVLSGKIVELGGMTFPGGAILFPLTYVFGDLFTEVYGYAQARRVIWAGFVGALLWAISYWIVAALPGASFWPHQEAFELVLGLGPRLAFAGMIAFLVGEFVNSYVVARLKVYTEGRYLALRLIASTAVGQALDTGLVLALAFSEVVAPRELIGMGLSLWTVKVVWEILALPLTIPAVRWLKESEHEDFFDTATNFNPFVFTKSGAVAEKGSPSSQ